jgi:hypothetical protein
MCSGLPQLSTDHDKEALHIIHAVSFLARGNDCFGVESGRPAANRQLRSFARSSQDACGGGRVELLLRCRRR